MPSAPARRPARADRSREFQGGVAEQLSSRRQARPRTCESLRESGSRLARTWATPRGVEHVSHVVLLSVTQTRRGLMSRFAGSVVFVLNSLEFLGPLLWVVD